jgi:hypothetical protein
MFGALYFGDYEVITSHIFLALERRRCDTSIAFAPVLHE